MPLDPVSEKVAAMNDAWSEATDGGMASGP